MISMSYNLSKLPIQSLLKPVFEAGTALARLDECIASFRGGKRLARTLAVNGGVKTGHVAEQKSATMVPA